MAEDDDVLWTATPADAVPTQTRRRLGAAPAGRLIQQVAGIDAWNAARRRRELLVTAAGLSREERLEGARHVEALQRTHHAIVRRTARGLDDAGPMHLSRPTVVVAHRHEWFAEKVSVLLGERGLTVLACTDNGPDALGAVVAEQPDALLAGDRLAMMTGDVLLEEARLFAPQTLRTVHAADPGRASSLRGKADAVFLRHEPPADLADTIAALVRLRLAACRYA